MSAKDLYHDVVKQALIRDGWTITHDPYTLIFGLRNVFVDLGAERFLAAEKGTEKIAVEIKSFRGQSEVRDLELAVGQYAFYRSLMVRYEPERSLFLAVPHHVLVSTLEEPIARPVLEDLKVQLVSFDPQEAKIVQWMS